jgi:hypothetical protein
MSPRIQAGINAAAVGSASAETQRSLSHPHITVERPNYET